MILDLFFCRRVRWACKTHVHVCHSRPQYRPPKYHNPFLSHRYAPITAALIIGNLLTGIQDDAHHIVRRVTKVHPNLNKALMKPTEGVFSVFYMAHRQDLGTQGRGRDSSMGFGFCWFLPFMSNHHLILLELWRSGTGTCLELSMTCCSNLPTTPGTSAQRVS